MRKLQYVGALMPMAVASALAPTVASGAVIFYTDRAKFEAALTAFQVETFTQNKLHDADLSFLSKNGVVTSNLFYDTVSTCCASTTWTFAKAVTAFGAEWNLAGPGGPGWGIEFYLDGGPRLNNSIPRTYSGQFFGFISDVPFSHRAYLWSYCSTQFSSLQAVVFDFADSRGGQHARDFLGLPGTPGKPAWQGKLVCDDFAGYKACFELGVPRLAAWRTPGASSMNSGPTTAARSASRR